MWAFKTDKVSKPQIKQVSFYIKKAILWTNFTIKTTVDKQHGATLPPWYVIFYQIVSPFVIFVIIGYKSGHKNLV